MNRIPSCRFSPSHKATVSALAAAAAAALSGWATPAHADYVQGVYYSAAPKQLAVRSNGVAYTITDVPGAVMGASAGVTVDADLVGTIKNWSAWLVAKAEHATGAASWSNDKTSMSFPFGNRPKSWASRIHIQVSHATLQNYVVSWCNELANDLRSSGMNNAQIFGQDRSYRIAFQVGTAAEFTSPAAHPAPPEVQNLDYAAGITVVCKASGGINPNIIPIGPLAPAPQARLTSMTMDVLHNPNPPSCPAQVNVRTTYVSDRAGPFSARVLSASGKVSQPLQFNMGEADRQGALYIKVHQQPMMVGVPGDPTRTPPSGPVGGSGVGSGYAPNPGPINPNDLPPAGPGNPPRGPGNVANPTDPRVFQDSLWAETLLAAPGSVQRTDYAGYRVQCPVVQGPVPAGPGVIGIPSIPTTRP